MCYYCYSSITALPFYNYPTTVLITTYLTQYGSYRTVAPFDPPTRNTIILIKPWGGHTHIDKAILRNQTQAGLHACSVHLV